MIALSRLISRFAELFGGDPDFVVHAPGRVNLIGEHTDYNDGFVLPVALQFGCTLLGRRREDRVVRAYSETFTEMAEFDAARPARDAELRWIDYLQAVAHILNQVGSASQGMDILVAGDVPIGAGLSSSAALEVGACLAFEASSGISLTPIDRAMAAQRAEREFVGVQCGIMDQFVSCNAQAGHALLLDTRTLGFQHVPIRLSGVSIVIGDTRKSRGLVDSEYNFRRSQCEEAVRLIAEQHQGVTALRDVTRDMLDYLGIQLDPVSARRARHVVTENLRVQQAAEALSSGDARTLGRLMTESHASLRDDYQVSCRELDVMVETALSVEGVYGSRMTGAGFGGCTVSLVDTQAVDDFQQTVGSIYASATGLAPAFYTCEASAGAQRLL